MRPTARIALLAMMGLGLVLVLAPGCASRKKITTSQVEPPPPAPIETSTETPPPPPAQEPTRPTERMALTDAFFDFDDYALRADAKTSLDQNAKYLESNSGAAIVIEGHCDERGSVEYNLALGEKRARAAKDYLVSYGITAGRMTTISYGKERPFDASHGESAWSKNRRAHFVGK